MTCVISEAFVKDIGRSDHASFWRYGYSALMVTDTVPFRNPPQQGTLNSPCKSHPTGPIARAYLCRSTPPGNARP
jgi:hypothetical protein